MVLVMVRALVFELLHIGPGLAPTSGWGRTPTQKGFGRLEGTGEEGLISQWCLCWLRCLTLASPSAGGLAAQASVAVDWAFLGGLISCIKPRVDGLKLRECRECQIPPLGRYLQCWLVLGFPSNIQFLELVR